MPPAYQAARAYKRLIMGENKSMSVKTLARYRPHLTDEQITDIEHLNKKRKEKCSKKYCRSDAEKKRKKTSKMSSEELLFNNPDSKIRQTTKWKHVSQYRGLLTTFK
eukprot:241166-Pleurochrysis_carterae.AAC.1